MLRYIPKKLALFLQPLHADSNFTMPDFTKWSAFLIGLLLWMTGTLAGLCPAVLSETDQRFVTLLEAGRDAVGAQHRVDDLLKRLPRFPYLPEIDIHHPDDGAVFPSNMAAPHFFWDDPFLPSHRWLVILETAGGAQVRCLTDRPRWVPDRTSWEWFRQHAGYDPARLTVIGVNGSAVLQPVTRTQITISISPDPFDGLIFYKQTRLPFLQARQHPEQSRWVLADIASYEPPRTVLEGVNACAHCHTFSPDGGLFGIDIDLNGDKGGYLMAETAPMMRLGHEEYITWNAYKPGDDRSSMGLFTKISPCGRFLISTVRETSLFAMLPDLAFSQLFFPVEGQLAVYDRRERRFWALPGADLRDAVQTCPEWRPDGQAIVFARAPVNESLAGLMDEKKFIEPRQGETIADLNRHYRIRFDLYTLPFNNGEGGTPSRLEGASHNGRSNFFPRYSPDGRWIAFSQSDNGLVLQPDSALYLVPSEGGRARRMRCNTGRMNSWHSWSPNSRWLVFASKAMGPYTELLLTHVDAAGNDSPPVALNRLNRERFAAVLPEVVPRTPNRLQKIRLEKGFVRNISKQRPSTGP